MNLDLSDVRSLNGKPGTLATWAFIAQDEVSAVSRGALETTCPLQSISCALSL
jgi:hypothetical protein